MRWIWKDIPIGSCWCWGLMALSIAGTWRVRRWSIPEIYRIHKMRSLMQQRLRERWLRRRQQGWKEKEKGGVALLMSQRKYLAHPQNIPFNPFKSHTFTLSLWKTRQLNTPISMVNHWKMFRLELFSSIIIHDVIISWTTTCIDVSFSHKLDERWNHSEGSCLITVWELVKGILFCKLGGG